MNFDIELAKCRDMDRIWWRWSVYTVFSDGHTYSKVGEAGTKWGAKRKIKKAIKSLESKAVPYVEKWTVER